MNDQHLAEMSLEFNRHIINLLDSLSALAELAQLSIHAMDEATLLKQALGALMGNQDMERCSIFLPDPAGKLHCVAGLDWDEMLQNVTGATAAAENSRPSRCGDEIMGQASKSGTLIHYSSCQPEAGIRQNCQGMAGALLCVPITCENEVLGVLNVFHPQPDFFNMWHERLSLLFCQSLGRLLANHRLTHRLNVLVDAKTAEIRELAYRDSLTGLPNRRLLLDRLNHALAQARRHQRAMAVMFLDLDRFKQINDTLGHAAGDTLLKQIAGRLITCVREGDTVARPSGDEFVIVLDEITQAEDAALVAEKIIATCAAPALVAGQELTITTSIGIAVHPAGGADDVDALMHKADAAMYQAKAAGRNRYGFFKA
ncbi:MAG: sensor domain-containing diguanylate cyclase [Rhodocyclaceae bacterium]|nr:sensor domain-containing diguanylate cyclase [Rhodocyclaceae bacterium]